MAKSRKNTTRGVGYERSYAPSDLTRLKNMYMDYTSGEGALETLPGYRSFALVEGRINSLARMRRFGTEYLVVHSGDRIFLIPAEGGECELAGFFDDTPSKSFTLGESLYFFNGEKIIALPPDSIAESITDSPYLPTTYKNGLPYEERNLITNESCQEYEVDTAEEFTYGSPHLLYSITSYESRECAVSGVDRTRRECLYVPSYKYIGGTRYAVTEILPHALEESLAEGLIVSEGVKKIGDNGVRSCEKLRRVILPTSLEEIGKYAFSGATELEYIRLGIGLRKIGTGALGLCPSLSEIAFEGDAAQLEAVEGYAVIEGRPLTYNRSYTSVCAAFSTYGSGFSPTSVTLDGTLVDFTLSEKNEVRLELNYKSDLEGKTVKIYGCEAMEVGMRCELGADLIASYGNKTTPEGAILGCTLATVFDGRVFLSGNPSLPGIIFYSTKTCDGEISPRYFGSYDFIDTGSTYPVSSLISLGDSLIVTKSGESGDGSVLYYRRSGETQRPISTRYIRSHAYKKAGGIDHAALYSGEPIFFSGGELYTLGGTPKRLVREDARVGFAKTESGNNNIFSLEWLGYLFVSYGGEVTLLDNRSERLTAYPLSGIGSYIGDTTVYEYSDTAPEGFTVSAKAGSVAYERVMSEQGSDGMLRHYVVEGGLKVAVTPTYELSGGDFYPASSAVTIGERLYFGTINPEVMVFNNDMRGVAPQELTDSADFDHDEYEAAMGDKIHPCFYDFKGHRIEFYAATEDDDCGETASYKTTANEGVLVSLSSPGGSVAELLASRDGCYLDSHTLTVGALDFSALDFSALSLTGDVEATYSLKEHQTPWRRHGIAIRSSRFRSPIRIESLTLGYKSGNKIKRYT